MPRGSEFYIASVVELHLRVPIQGRKPKIAASSKQRFSGGCITLWCFEISSGPHQSWLSEKQHLHSTFHQEVQHYLCWGYHLVSKIPHLSESFRLLLQHIVTKNNCLFPVVSVSLLCVPGSILQSFTVSPRPSVSFPVVCVGFSHTTQKRKTPKKPRENVIIIYLKQPAGGCAGPRTPLTFWKKWMYFKFTMPS